ncbi:SH3 domain-binding glutamic acid-rich protein homolog [Venturia canescens]|uniref:SH3 domain-binding glutamic acid-rich protein homolog n=1 Tax=Venturia canescens TaxID=32260 RepID=UPI001C9CF78A|nr:SH3 domain-binding glutamic acid-rich protein homolog [Venturia canescens]
MPVKVYISGISGNKEVKKRQQRVLMILDSKNVEYEVIDITEPGKEDEKEFMQGNSTAKTGKYPLPPQIFNDEDYCGDYEDFDLSNEIDELEKFLKLVPGTTDVSRKSSMQSNNIHQNGNASSREASMDKDTNAVHSEGDLDERPSATTGEKDEDKARATESETGGTRETGDELDSEDIDESAERNEEKSDDQEQEE